MSLDRSIIFFGTPEFAAAHLSALAENGEAISGVVSRPDMPKGRGRLLEPTPVRLVAEKLGIELAQPVDLRDGKFIEWLKRKEPWLIVTVAYGKIIPKEILDLPSIGAWNVHASLLPRWRGAAPINRAVQHGDKKTGATIMQMDEGLDTGDILLQRETKIGENETAGELRSRLTAIGCKALIECVEAAKRGEVRRIKQAADGVTYAGMIDKKETEMDWNWSAEKLHNHVRAFSPLPGARTGDLKIFSTEISPNPKNGEPGTINEIAKRGVVVNVSDGAILIGSVQPAGKNNMNAADYTRGRKLNVGDRLIESLHEKGVIG